MDVDIIIDSTISSQELCELGLLAEKHGIRCVWNANMLIGRDPFTNMAQLARESSRIKIAPMAINAYEMHPFRIAMNLLTLNELAPGRVEAMIGGGGETVMSLGIPFERRVGHVKEALEFVRGAMNDRPFTYDGSLFKVKDYNPPWVSDGPKPFLFAGANRPMMLKMAATTADGIMLSDLTPNLCRERIDKVHAYRSEAGLSNAGYRFNNFLAWYVYEDPAEARFEARRWIGFRALFRDYMMLDFMDQDEFQQILHHMDAIYAMAPANTDRVEGLDDELLDRCVDHLTLTGGVEDLDRIIAELLEFKALGITEVAFKLQKHYAHSIKLLGERVIPALQ